MNFSYIFFEENLNLDKEKALSSLEGNISQVYRFNKVLKDEQREIEVKLTKTEGLEKLLTNLIYGRKRSRKSMTYIHRGVESHKVPERRGQSNLCHYNYVEDSAV